MESKEALPPAYSDICSPEAGVQNVGYAPTSGTPDMTPPNAVGYPPQYAYQAPYGVAPPNYYTGAQPNLNIGAPQQGQYNYQTVVVAQPTPYSGVTINQVPDNMGLAIFATICCCWPIGIVAIMRAQEARRSLAIGDFQRALTYSQESRRFSLFAIAGGCVSLVFAIIILVVVINSYNRVY